MSYAPDPRWHGDHRLATNGSHAPGDELEAPMVPIISRGGAQPWMAAPDSGYAGVATTQAPRGDRERITSELERLNNEPLAPPRVPVTSPLPSPLPIPPSAYQPPPSPLPDLTPPTPRRLPRRDAYPTWDNTPSGPPYGTDIEIPAVRPPQPASGAARPPARQQAQWQPPAPAAQRDWRSPDREERVSYTWIPRVHTMAGLSYLFGLFSGIPIYVAEREHRFVRFHAMQSIFLSTALIIYAAVAAFLIWLIAPHVAWLAVMLAVIAVLFGLIGVGAWLAAMFSAWNGRYLPLRYIGPFALKYAEPPGTLQ
ncbi:MAG TPA: hypothetical protein VF807_10675 [Ktedonobacterales bacterium]